LDAGDTLGHHAGPTTIFVPTDPANREYAEILANDHPVDPYVPPEPSPPTPLELAAHPEGPMDAVTKAYVDDAFSELYARLGVTLPAREA
jgi:hypothetical protein